MNEKKQDLINKTRKRLLMRSGWKCEICGKYINDHNSQIAHKLSKSKMNIKKYGLTFIHGDHNLNIVCGLECNQKASVGITKEYDFIREMKERGIL